MARRKIFGNKTFSKKHKSRRGRKITSNKTRRFRGGINLIGLATTAAKFTPQGRAGSMADKLAQTSQGQALMSNFTNMGHNPNNGTLLNP